MHSSQRRERVQDLWGRLDDQMAAQPAPADDAAGLWGQIVVARAEGLWSEANKETVLLSKPGKVTPSAWDQANDETLILPREGLLPIWQAVLAQADAPGTVDLANTIQMHRPEVRIGVWDQAQNETVMISRSAVSNVYGSELKVRDLTTWRPHRLTGWALKELTDHAGQTYWILKNLRTDSYVRLNEEQLFVWHELDGKASVQEIAIHYMIQYGKLAINSLVLLLDQLQEKGFIEDPLVNVYGEVDESMAERRANVWWRRLMRAFLNKEFAIHGIDGFITRTYRWGGRLLFTWPAALLFALISVVGAGAFLLHIQAGQYSVFTGEGESLVLGLITMYVLQFLILVIHEWSHAITTKHYRREVRKGGFLIYLGMPAAFVDTTDIWMSPRRPRIMVSWAGPYSGFIIGGLAALLIFVVPSPLAQGVLFQTAFLTYLTSFMNLNPLLKLDGYYILMDWLEIPRLREKSLAFVTGSLWQKLRRREPFRRDERIFAIFGLLAGAWTLLALLLALQLWGGALLDLITWLANDPLGRVILALVVLGGLFLVFRRRIMRLLLARRRRAVA